jgi:hypothetical protein
MSHGGIQKFLRRGPETAPGRFPDAPVSLSIGTHADKVAYINLTLLVQFGHARARYTLWLFAQVHIAEAGFASCSTHHT